jgi:hypothetical protein
MSILARFRSQSLILRTLQVLVCALFVLNLSAHFSHDHELKPGVSSERLICPYCCVFSAAMNPPESAAAPVRTAGLFTLAHFPEESSFVSPPVIARWARGPPLIRPASSTSFS